MPGYAILPDPERLRLLCVYVDGDGITLAARAADDRPGCPQCGQRSERVHSGYVRRPADLPWHGRAVRLRLHVRRFFCDNVTCRRRIFAEQLPGVVAPYARRTDRLATWFTHVAFALGGQAGSRLLRSLGVSTSGDALLRHIRRFRVGGGPTPRVLSIDDFAFRRGRTYGSILVDLECHRVVDLLPDRTAKTFADWLAQHPGVGVISRDRSGEYAEGARRGAPAAVQIADRFHLLKNLGEAVERVLRRHARLVERVPAPEAPQVSSAALRPDREASRERVRAEMRERFEAIQAAAAEGLNTSAIARALGLHRHTVQKYLPLAAAPERRHRTRRTSALAPYYAYLLERWQQGCRNGRELWREVVARGYPGVYQNVARFVAHLRRHGRTGRPLPQAVPGLTPRHGTALLLTRPGALTDEQHLARERLEQLHPDITRAVALLDRFAGMIRDRPTEQAAERLLRWMEDARNSGIAELANFATKLGQDAEAVLAGLTLPYSQGQTEGRVNKLKLIKRSMYGRANFDLLRQRVLYAAAS